MKKRLLAMLTTVAVLVSSFVVPTAVLAEDAFEAYAQDAALLSALGLYNVDIDEDLGFDATETVTAADFIEAVVKMKVGAFDEGTDYLSIAKQYNILNVETEYKTDDDISFNDAVKVIIDALGYELVAEARGGYPYGFMAVARDIDLLDDVEYKVNGVLELGNAIKLLANAVDAPYAQHNVYGETKYNFTATEGKTLLSKHRDIVKIAGLVKANDVTTLDEVSSLLKGEVQIGANVYNAGTTNAQAMLGKYVTAYIQKIEGREKDKVLYISDDNYLNKELTVASEYITNVNDRCTQVEYETESGKVRKVNLSPSRRVIYNGVVYYDFTKADFTGKNATVRFVDYTGDSDYDVVFIDRYDTFMFVNYTSVSEGIIFNQYQNEAYAERNIKLDLDTPENYNIMLKDGTPLTIKDIQKNDVASIYRSKNPQKPMVQVVITRDTFTGVYKSLNKDNGEYVIETEAGDTVYKYNNVYYNEIVAPNTKITQPVLGASYTYYLDATGAIMAAVGEDEIGWEYALLYGAKRPSGLSADIDVKYLSASGDWVTTKFAKKVTVIGATTDTYTADQLYENYLPQMPCVIMVKTDANGNLKQMRVAVDSNVSNKNMLTYKNFSHKYDSSYHMGSQVFFENDIVVFVMPDQSNGKGAPEDYLVTSSGYFKLNNTYNYNAYNLDEFNFTSCISLVDNGVSSDYSNATLFLVTEIRDELNSDDEACKKLYGAMGAYTEIGLELADSSIADGVMGSDGEYTTKPIKVGDVLQLSTDIKGKINAKKTLYTLEAGLSPDAGSNTLLYNGYTGGTIKRIDAEKGRMIINIKGTDTPAKFSTSVSVNVYDVKNNIVTKSKATDILEGDFVVARYGIYNPAEIIVIRK